MYINKAIRDLMKAKNVSLLTMAKALVKSVAMKSALG